MNYKEKIEGMLVEGFATAPSRCWACEARTPKEEIAGKREQNLEHIGIIADSVTSLLEQAQRDAVGGLRVRQISGFQRDELGRWYKRYPTGMVLVTDEMLLDALNVRQENIDSINEYLNQTKEDINPKEGE